METIEHLLVSCKTASGIWLRLKELAKNYSNVPLIISAEALLIQTAKCQKQSYKQCVVCDHKTIPVQTPM